MPHLIPLILAGAGLYTGARWLSRQLTNLAQDAQAAAEEVAKRAAKTTHGPRNLGTLEFDPADNVYRPRSPGPQ